MSNPTCERTTGTHFIVARANFYKFYAIGLDVAIPQPRARSPPR